MSHNSKWDCSAELACGWTYGILVDFDLILKQQFFEVSFEAQILNLGLKHKDLKLVNFLSITILNACFRATNHLLRETRILAKCSKKHFQETMRLTNEHTKKNSSLGWLLSIIH